MPWITWLSGAFFFFFNSLPFIYLFFFVDSKISLIFGFQILTVVRVEISIMAGEWSMGGPGYICLLPQTHRLADLWDWPGHVVGPSLLRIQNDRHTVDCRLTHYSRWQAQNTLEIVFIIVWISVVCHLQGDITDFFSFYGFLLSVSKILPRLLWKTFNCNSFCPAFLHRAQFSKHA